MKNEHITYYHMDVTWSVDLAWSYCLFGIGESYGLTAQHITRLHILIIQLNIVNKLKNKRLPPYVNFQPQGGTVWEDPVSLFTISAIL